MKQGVQMYAVRCQSMSKLELLELPEAHQGSSKPNTAKAKIIEASNLSKNPPAISYVIALDQYGQQLSSEDLAELIARQTTQGKSIVFQIGGSWGLDVSVLKKADKILSLGKITLPHSLARLLLMEQIYRAHTIINERRYHK